MILQLALAVLLIGCLLSAIIPIRRGRRLAQASESWPSVRGQIVEMSNMPTAWSDLPKIEYAYSVGGNMYHATAITFGWQHGKQQRLKALQVGDVVMVHYAPDDPAQAVLFPGGSAARQLLSEPPVLLNLIFSGAVSLLFVAFLLRDVFS